MSILVRLVEPDEHDAVDALVTWAYEHDYGPSAHGDDELRLSRVRATRFDVWVAIDDETGTLVGTVTSTAENGEQLMEDAVADELDFRLLAVSPAARRRGIGALLTRHVIAVATERGRGGVFMKSAPDMLGAHALYERIGFRRDTARDGLVIDGEIVFDLFAFALDLPARTAAVAAEASA